MPATNRYEFEQQLFTKAFADASFQRLLQSDPQKALEQTLGISLPTGVTVQLLVEDAKTIYALLPNASHTVMGTLDLPSQLKPDSRERMEAALIAKIVSDPSLLQAFLADPTGTVGANISLPSGATVIPVKESSTKICLIVPYFGKETYKPENT